MTDEELTAVVDKLWDTIEPEARVSGVGHVILIVINPDASTSILKQGGRLPQHVVGDTLASAALQTNPMAAVVVTDSENPPTVN